MSKSRESVSCRHLLTGCQDGGQKCRLNWMPTNCVGLVRTRCECPELRECHDRWATVQAREFEAGRIAALQERLEARRATA